MPNITFTPPNPEQRRTLLEEYGFKFDRRKAIEEVNALTDRIQKEYEEGNRPIEKRPRILVTGCPIGGNAMKVVKSIEENGGNVVCFENCSGAKSVDELINEDTPDIYQAIADRYLNIGCSCMTPDENRFKLLGRLLGVRRHAQAENLQQQTGAQQHRHQRHGQKRRVQPLTEGGKVKPLHCSASVPR